MNMDIKDLIAKLKSGSGKDSKKAGGSSLTAFLDKNPKMKIIIPVVLIVISVLVAVVIIVTTKSPDIDTTPVGSGEAQQVDALPQDVRDLEDIEIEGGNVFDEVDVANAKITAIIKNSDGYYTAVMETKTNSYSTLNVGDYINGSSWMVEDITDDSVLIALGEKKVEIKYGK